MRKSVSRETQRDAEVTCSGCSALHSQIDEFINIVKHQQQTINALDTKMSELMSMLCKLQPNQEQATTSVSHSVQEKAASTVRSILSDDPGQHLAWSSRSSQKDGGTAAKSVWSQPWVQQHHLPTDSEIAGASTAATTDSVNSHFAMIVHRTLNDMSKRKRNVIVSGLPEEDEYGNDDQSTFTELCEAFLPTKPSLSDGNCCKRIGKAQHGKPRKLLVRLNSEDAAAALLRAAPSLRHSSDSYIASSVFINPDLPPAAAKLAYEVRQRRRESRNRRLVLASVADADTMDTGFSGELVSGPTINS